MDTVKENCEKLKSVSCLIKVSKLTFLPCHNTLPAFRMVVCATISALPLMRQAFCSEHTSTSVSAVSMV